METSSIKVLTLAMSMCTSAIFAQESFNVRNSFVMENLGCNLSKVCVVMPVPQNNIYQDIEDVKVTSGEILENTSGNKYIRDINVNNLPSKGETYELSENFNVTLYPMYIDMSQFTTIYPYDKNSEIYRKYVIDRGEFIDTRNTRITEISDRLWMESDGNILSYAESCYEYVADNFKYLNPYTGIHPIDKILTDGGGDCGNLASIYVNLLRAKGIPAKHIVTVRPDGSYHVWADFYLEKYGWIPVDVNMKLDNPEGNYFGYCLGDGIVMSEDIFYEIEYDEGEFCDVVLLQNYYYWYWADKFDMITAQHNVSSRMTGKPELPVVVETDENSVKLKMPEIQGATSYRIELTESSAFPDGTEVYEVEKNTEIFTLNDLNSLTDYTILFKPIRVVGNIETTMGEYSFGFRTTDVPSGLETTDSGISLASSKGNVLVSISQGTYDLEIYSMSGSMVKKISVNSTVNIQVPEQVLIVKAKSLGGKSFTKKLNCM